jgi:hypothetical protein
MCPIGKIPVNPEPLNLKGNAEIERNKSTRKLEVIT